MLFHPLVPLFSRLGIHASTLFQGLEKKYNLKQLSLRARSVLTTEGRSGTTHTSHEEGREGETFCQDGGGYANPQWANV